MRGGKFSEMQENPERLRQLQEERQKRRLEDEIADLDENTDEFPEESDEVERDYSSEELQDIWDNDPGYVNERAMKKLDDPSMKDSGYLKTGLHSRRLLNYGKDALDDTEQDTLISEGKLLERWGSEAGTYLTEPGTDFRDLHLDVTEDKLERNSYEVVKPFWVTESRIAPQPFDEKDDTEKKREPAVQYHARICVEDLIEMGFLKKKEDK